MRTAAQCGTTACRFGEIISDTKKNKTKKWIFPFFLFFSQTIFYRYLSQGFFVSEIIMTVLYFLFMMKRSLYISIRYSFPLACGFYRMPGKSLLLPQRFFWLHIHAHRRQTYYYTVVHIIITLFHTLSLLFSRCLLLFAAVGCLGWLAGWLLPIDHTRQSHTHRVSGRTTHDGGIVEGHK